MFGFVIGTICLVLLIGVVSRRRWHGAYGSCAGYGGGCGGCGRGSCGGGCGGGYRYRGGFGPRAFLWRLLRRIDATPAQEKVFRDELGGLIETGRGLRDTLQGTRADLASALR